MPKIKGLVNYIDQPLYDRVTVATANTTQLTAFQTPLGQSSKTTLHTNMRLAGQISTHQEALIYALRLVPVLVAAHTYSELANQVMNAGYLVFEIMQKTFLELPLLLTPGGAGIMGSTTANNAVILTNGFAANANKHRLAYPVKINKGQNFSVTLNWGTAPSLTTAMDLYVVLDAYIKRPVL